MKCGQPTATGSLHCSMVMSVQLYALSAAPYLGSVSSTPEDFSLTIICSTTDFAYWIQCSISNFHLRTYLVLPSLERCELELHIRRGDGCFYS